MKACRGLVCSAAVLAFAGMAAAQLTMPQVQNKMRPVDWDQPQSSGAAFSVNCESTGFEAAEAQCAWEAGFGLCGSTFICRDRNVDPPYPSCSAAQPNPDNCCVAKPHPINRWFMSGSSQHCQEPSIRTDHPKTGLQHITFQRSTLGGNPAGCTSPILQDQTNAANLACRLSAFTATEPPTNPGVTTIGFDISREVDTGLPAAEMAITQQGTGFGPLYMRIHFLGYAINYDFEAGAYFLAGTFVANQYHRFEMIHDVCNDSIDTYWDGVLVHEGKWLGGQQSPSPRQTVFTHDNVSPGRFDIDNFLIDRVLIATPACPMICGDGIMQIGEECEPGVAGGGADPKNDECCPGRCGAFGTPEECTCAPTDNNVFTGCATPRDLVNGVNGPFISDGGFYRYVADANFTSVETCGSDFDSQIFWDLTPDCSMETMFNDDCINDDYAGGQTAGDVNASCYSETDFVAQSCVCNATTPGEDYTFLVAEWQAAAPGTTLIPPFCSSTIVTITKKTSCAAGGVIAGGACCDQLTGMCSDGVAAQDCADPTDIYYPNKLCELASVPDCVALTGSCCNTAPGAGGQCNVTTLGECPTTPYQSWTLGGTCEAGSCLEVTGACCNTAPGAGGACAVTIQGECPTTAYQSWTEGATCEEITCDEVVGSCCNTLSGNCAPGVVQGLCGPGADFVWTEGGSCSTCAARLGACCVEPDRLTANCSATTLAQCDAAGGVWSDGQDCANVICTPDFIPIPTVSEWGLAVLALMLLIGGKIYFSRREAATA